MAAQSGIRCRPRTLGRHCGVLFLRAPCVIRQVLIQGMVALWVSLVLAVVRNLLVVRVSRSPHCPKADGAGHDRGLDPGDALFPRGHIDKTFGLSAACPITAWPPMPEHQGRVSLERASRAVAEEAPA